jgi:regulatory protein
VENRKAEPLQKAKNYAFLLLKFRPRSEKEIGERLKRKKFDTTVIRETILFLKENGFVDDSYFAKVWLESRIKRPLGLRKLRVELRQKGINKEIIDSQVEEISKGYCEEEIVSKLAKERLNKLKGIEPEKAKRRLFDYLLRRGFSAEVIIDIVNQLKHRDNRPW